MPDAPQMIRDDHKRVKELFREFEDAQEPREMKRIADEAIRELEVHAELEEKLFYPKVRREIGEDELMNEAEEEHHVAKLVIAEVAQMDPSDEHFRAKFMVLAESVKHHIEEEESEMLPKAAELGMDRMNRLGEEMAQKKQQLERQTEGKEPGEMSRSAVGASMAAMSGNGRRSGGTTRRRSTGTRSRSTAGGTRGRSTGGSTRGRSTGGTTRRRTGAAGRTAAAARGGRRSSTSGTTRRRTTGGTTRRRTGAAGRTAAAARGGRKSSGGAAGRTAAAARGGRRSSTSGTRSRSTGGTTRSRSAGGRSGRRESSGGTRRRTSSRSTS